MADAQVAQTLEALRAQRAGAEARVEKARRELEDADVVLARLAVAVESLEMLLSPVHGDGPVEDVEEKPSKIVQPMHENRAIDAAADASRESKEPHQPPPALAPYTSPSGGKRLKSKMMVHDLLKRIGQPVPRYRLVNEFFAHYGREDLQDYWVRPDNALNTAIDRSRDEGLILEAKDPSGGPSLYSVGWQYAETGQPAMLNEEENH